ncbi:MAG: NAD+ synthase [Acidobacteriaceae bacterium]
MKIALAQINPTVGDLDGNTRKIIAFADKGRSRGAELVIFPELSVTGYPPRDLVDVPAVVEKNLRRLDEIAAATRGIRVIVGAVTPAHAQTGKSVMNSAVVLMDGKVRMVQSKMLLPTYDVFDEQRYFAAAQKQQLIPELIPGHNIALTICEDAWNDKQSIVRRMYSVDPVDDLIRAGGDFLVNISASPFHAGKQEYRLDLVRAIAAQHQVPVVMVNQVGGNDSLIFDGSSIAVAADGTLLAQAKSFEEDLVVFDSEANGPGDIHEWPRSDEECTYRAIVLGTRDYVRKCGFERVLVGLSGGIDSAVVACIAVDALGEESVIGVGMPSQYSSRGSLDDARALAENLNIRFETAAIRDLYDEYERTLEPVFAAVSADWNHGPGASDVTYENVQSRIRGTLLMALSNRYSALVLATGNKSEMAVGYCTLYGDMVGGLAPIADLLKTSLYKVARWINREREMIPRATLEKPPSAELRPDQRDSDTLPPYEVLDGIIGDFVEGYRSAAQIAEERSVDIAVVERVLRMIERSEYKRQQAAPILKVTAKAFGAGRRFPIAAKIEI